MTKPKPVVLGRGLLDGAGDISIGLYAVDSSRWVETHGRRWNGTPGTLLWLPDPPKPKSKRRTR